MRPRWASAPRVRSLPNQHRVVDRERQQARQALDQVALLASVHVGHDIFERDRNRRALPAPATPCRDRFGPAPRTPRSRDARGGRRIGAGCELRRARWSGWGSSASLRQAGTVSYPRRARPSTPIVVGQRTYASELEPHRASEEAEAHGLDDLAEVERSREGLRQRVQRHQQLVGRGHLGGFVDRGGSSFSISVIKLHVNTPSAPHNRNTTTICPAERWSVASTDCIMIVAAAAIAARDRRAENGSTQQPHTVTSKQQSCDRREDEERAGEAAGHGAGRDREHQLDHQEPDAGGRVGCT